ncbi:MAG TPA: STAS domain-containing protein [Anaerolineales bacterium]|jgi:anti-anti-sigma factor|nr:STAS domain-containing protein [Anaerolineales bacterium]
MGSDFKMTSEQVQGKNPVSVIHLAGWLDVMSEGKLVEAIQKEKANGAKFVLLELSEMDTITSAGIRAMQRAYQILTPKDEPYKVAHLKLCNAPAQIYQVLGITGFLANVPMFESMQDAIDSFQS